MKTIILDIETKPKDNLIDYCVRNIEPNKTLKDPVKVQADIERKKEGLRKSMAVDTDLCDIVCIGVKEEGKEPLILRSIEEFASYINSQSQLVRWVTFGGTRFDMPILCKHMAIKCLYGAITGLLQATRRYIDNHIDLEEVLAFGTKNYRSLDEYCMIYLGREKTPIDFETATQEEIEAHCKEDLCLTEALFNTFKGGLFV